MAKLAEKIKQQADAAGLIDPTIYEPQPADWAAFAEALDAGDANAAATWAARFDIPRPVLPILARVRPLAEELERAGAEEEALYKRFRAAEETVKVLGRTSPSSLAEAEAVSARRVELESEVNRLRAGHLAAKHAREGAIGLRSTFRELFDGQPGGPMLGLPDEIQVAFHETGLALLYNRPWRESVRREPVKRKPKYVLRS